MDGGAGGDGNSCALGDIAFYEKPAMIESFYVKNSRENSVGIYLGLPLIKRGEFSPLETYSDISSLYGSNYSLALSAISDLDTRWPIEELQRLIAWEEAAQTIDAVDSTLIHA